MPTWIHDIRYALRQLGKTPGFAAMAVLTLALGMGANVTIFSLISGVLFRPFPGQREGELVRLYCRSEKPEGGYRRFSYPYYRELKEQNASFRSLSAFTFAIVGIREHDFMRRLGAGFITSDFFGTFGVHVARGRSFRPEEEAPGSRIPVAIISDRLWQRFGSDPNLVGQSIVLDNVPVTVVGVLPPAFVSASSITNWEVWLPLGMLDVFSRTPLRDGPSRLEQHGYRRLFLLGQLKPNVTPAEAQSELDILAAHLAESFPAEYRDCRLLAGPMATIKVSSAPDDDLPLGLPMAAALVVSGAVLLIACVNLAYMFLARCLNRQRETGIRLALGCSSLRIIRQFLTEGCLLSLLGGAASLSVASWSARILAHFFEQMTGGEGTVPIHLDWRSAGWTGILCLFSVLLFSLVPAWRLSRVCPSSAMKDPTGWFPRGRSTWVLFLVGTQVALAFVLVACANLFVRSAWNAARGNPGFALERGLIVEMDLAFSIRDERRAREVYQAALDRLRLMPGVEAVSLAWTVPYDNTETSGSYQRSAPSTGASPQASPSRASVNIVTSDYFRTLGVSLLQGREFTRQEEQKGDGPRVAIIDELLARRLWPSENPIGLFMQSDGDAADAIQIVGIVPSLRETIMEPQAEPHVYLPFGQHYRSDMYLHIRTQPHVPDALQTSLIQKVREELQALDPTLPVLSVRTWDEHVRHSMEFWAMRMGAGLFAILGILALGLAAVGLFSVKSYWVAQRTREIGVRMALGATERMIVGQVLREALGAALIGLSLGLLLIWISARFLNSLLLDARGTDPMVLLATLTVLLTVLLLASLLPARRAARIHPMEALKQE